MLNEFVKPKQSEDAGQPLPTGTFRKQESDGWAELDFNEPTNKHTGGFNNTKGSFLSGGKPNIPDDDDFENILDDLEEKKGIASTKRAKTAIERPGMKDSMWTAGRQTGGFRAQENNSNLNMHDELDDLDGLGDDDDDDDGDDTDVGAFENRQQFSAGKSMAHQRSND